MTLKMINGKTHTDHGLTEEQLDWILGRAWAFDEGVQVTTLEMPEHLGDLPCGLYGPKMGDNPISEAEVVYEVRGNGRRWASRMCFAPMRRTRLVTVVAGPIDATGEHYLYTVYGGPEAPREPGDDTIEKWEALVESRRFWKDHALAKPKAD